MTVPTNNPMSDHEAIRQVIARQAQLRDDDRVDEWIDNWADDGVFITEAGRHEGKAAVKALADTLTTGKWRALHLLSQPWIEVDGDRARAETDFVIVTGGGERGFRVRGVNRYHDRFVRSPEGRWLYRERRVEPREREL